MIECEQCGGFGEWVDLSRHQRGDPDAPIYTCATCGGSGLATDWDQE